MLKATERKNSKEEIKYSLANKTMNLKDELLREYSKEQTRRISGYIGTDEHRFSDLMSLFLTEHYRINQRAAAIINDVTDRHPSMIKPYMEKLVMNLYNEGLHDAVKRNTIRVLQFVEIPEDLWGHTAEICFGYLASNDEPIAVKAFSMTVLEKICKEVPELTNELRVLIEDQLPYSSTGFKNRGNKILNRIGRS